MSISAMEHLVHDIWHLTLQVAVAALVAGALLMVWRDLSTRHRLPQWGSPAARARKVLSRMRNWRSGRSKPEARGLETTDTIFVLPDISGYSKLIAAYERNIEKAREPVFSLMNALMDGIGDRMSLSKVDGDAVLFYRDAEDADPRQIGAAVLSMMTAFDLEKRRLATRHRDDPLLAERIENLDIKVLIHRGPAVRFDFSGVIDHFGAAVTLTYKLLKNGVCKRRYVLRTRAAKNVVQFPDGFSVAFRKQDVEELGIIGSDVFDVPPFGSLPSTGVPSAGDGVTDPPSHARNWLGGFRMVASR